MVERTAHNGLVIGSNPIKLKHTSILSSMEEHSPSKRSVDGSTPSGCSIL